MSDAPDAPELSGVAEPQTHEPQSGQTHRVEVRPLSAVRWIGRSSPSANSRTLLRNICSSSERMFSGTPERYSMGV